MTRTNINSTMNEKNTDILKKDNEKREKLDLDQFNYLNSNPNRIMKSLMNPTFLGSVHIKKDLNPTIKPVNDILKNELEMKLTQSIKNVVFNPITLILIFIALIFNIFWVISLLFL